MGQFQVVEQFDSINGEGQRAGELAHFVRFAGCNLRCSFCDTMWANNPDAPYKLLSEEEIYRDIKESGIRNVTLTGGEPLLQKNIGRLLRMLNQDGELAVEIETNGSVDIGPFMEYADNLYFTLDYKLPGSGMEGQMLTENYQYLRPQDTVKFVCGSREDLERALDIIKTYSLIEKCKVYLSPVFGRIEPSEMVDFMLAQGLGNVRLQLQLHKFIWDPDKRGV